MEEKMMILKMLQEGKISSEEALKLLNAVETKTSGQEPPRMGSEFRDRINEIKMDEKINRAANNTERFANDFSKRMESFGNDVAESAVKLADKIVGYFGGMFDMSGDKFQYNKSFSYPVGDNLNVYLKASNFSVRVNPVDSPNLVLNLYVNSNQQQLNIEQFLKVDMNENNYSFETQFPERTWGKIELMVPKNIQSISIYTSNGKCELNEVTASTIKCHTSNGKVGFYACNANEIETVTNNGKAVMENTSSANAYVSTSNGKIDLSECRFDALDAKTSNGSILASGVYRLNAKEARYNMYTSNGKIQMELSKCSESAYMIDANTSLGHISIELPELCYTIDKKSSATHSNAQVKSTNFDEAENKIFIKADTSNASITIEGN